MLTPVMIGIECEWRKKKKMMMMRIYRMIVEEQKRLLDSQTKSGRISVTVSVIECFVQMVGRDEKIKKQWNEKESINSERRRRKSK